MCHDFTMTSSMNYELSLAIWNWIQAKVDTMRCKPFLSM